MTNDCEELSLGLFVIKKMAERNKTKTISFILVSASFFLYVYI